MHDSGDLPSEAPPRITKIDDRWKVGPLGRAIAARGGAHRTVDPGGNGVVTLAPGGQVMPAPSAHVSSRPRRSWMIVVLLVVAAGVLTWSIGSRGASVSTDSSGATTPAPVELADPVGLDPDPGLQMRADVTTDERPTARRHRMRHLRGAPSRATGRSTRSAAGAVSSRSAVAARAPTSTLPPPPAPSPAPGSGSSSAADAIQLVPVH